MDGGFFEAVPGSVGKGSGAGKGKGISIRPVTIAQLCKIKDSLTMDAQARLDGQEVSHVTLVGKVCKHSGGPEFELDDGTGRATTADSAVQLDEGVTATYAEGQYVRVVGELSNVGMDGAILNAFKVRPITDYNEIVFHFLECVFVTQHFTQLDGGAGPAAGHTMGHGAGPVAGGYMAARPVAPGSGCMDSVLRLLQEPDHMIRDDGTHISEIINALRNQFPEAAIRGALDELTQAGSIYSASSDEHFKSLGA